jgi:putative DNA primase/helicase
MSDDIEKKVKARIEAEQKNAPAAEKKPELSDWDIIRCARENVAGDAAVYIVQNLGLFVYVERWGSWLKYMGHYWQRDLKDGRAIAAVSRVVDEYRRVSGELRRMAKDGGQPSADEDPPEPSKYSKPRRGSSTGSYDDELKVLSRKISILRGPTRKNVIEYARSCPDDRLVIDGEQLDSDPWILACANGVIELKSGEHRPGRPGDYLTCAVVTPWKSMEEPCPIFAQFVSEILGDKQDMVDYLQRMLGHALIGKQREHVFLVLAGSKGRNGKDTLMNILRFVLGLNVMVPVPAEMLLDQGYAKSSSGPAPDLMTLRGRRLVYASETDEGRRFSSSKVKWLSGGGQLVARGTYDLEMSYWDASHSLILLTNDLPHAKADDQAFWSRLHLVNFRYSFLPNPDPDNEFERAADPDLLEKMKAEASGILAWLVRGCLEYQRLGLAPPEEVTNAAKAYRESEDVVGRFIVECCEVKDGEEIQSTALYDSFRYWYAQNVSKKHTFPKNKFGEIMAEKGYSKRKSSVWYWQGLTITEDFNRELIKADEARGKK